jgi:hypothetical protein
MPCNTRLTGRFREMLQLCAGFSNFIVRQLLSDLLQFCTSEYNEAAQPE